MSTMDIDPVLAELRARLAGLGEVSDDVIETEVAMEVSAQAHVLLGEQMTLLTSDGVVTGTLTDYDVSPARLEDGVVHVDLGLRVAPDPGHISITIVEV